MSILLRDALMAQLGELRYEPTDKRIRATLGDATVIDSTRALLVWEPKRVVPTYAVPVEDIAAEVTRAQEEGADPPAAKDLQLDGRPVWDPSIPFSVRTTEGEAVTLRAEGGGREAAAFRASDEDLEGYLIVDFDAFDAWYEEDERNLGHPRDPFHRIDIVHSSRHVKVERDGQVLADSSNACLLFESPLPVRYYLPREDVRMDLLRPSAKKSFCAYKGQASYWALEGAGDIAWSYPEPLREAAEVSGRICFLNEETDIVVDGKPLERPVTPFSRS
jgi:uncharacterized protein (DUF427 family)